MPNFRRYNSEMIRVVGFGTLAALFILVLSLVPAGSTTPDISPEQHSGASMDHPPALPAHISLAMGPAQVPSLHPANQTAESSPELLKSQSGSTGLRVHPSVFGILRI
jgi:hypothetical protein